MTENLTYCECCAKFAQRTLDLDRLKWNLGTLQYDKSELQDDLCVAQARITALEAALTEIIYVSDNCGHRNCYHSMEPWQRARRLLEGVL